MDDNSSAPAQPYRIGLDVGGTKIEGIVLDNQGREVVRLRRATPVAAGYGAVIENIAQHYRELAVCIGDAPHTLGMGTPGSISPSTALLRNCNATVLNGKPLKADLESRIGRSFCMANDANCFVLAEARLGAARPFQDVLGLVLGTGVGAGLVIGGQVVTGRNGIAGEWGHMVLDPSGPACYCGRRGCVERYLSGPSLAHAYGDCAGLSIDAQDVVRLARAGNPGAAATLDRFLDHFAHALANVIAVVDPQAIVLGGGLASIDEIYTQGVQRLRRLVFSDRFETPVLRNRLGNAAGVFGAAMIGV